MTGRRGGFKGRESSILVQPRRKEREGEEGKRCEIPSSDFRVASGIAPSKLNCNLNKIRSKINLSIDSNSDFTEINFSLFVMNSSIIILFLIIYLSKIIFRLI